MTDNTLLTVCTEKRLLKLSFFQYSRWIQNFSTKMQNDTLLTTCTKNFPIKLIGFTTHGEYKNVLNKCKTSLTVCSETLLLKVSCFTAHGEYKIFLNKCRMRRFSRCVPKNFYKKLNCLYYPSWIQILSEKMQDNTLLTVCAEKRLLKLSFFQYSRWIQNYLKNAERYFTHDVHQKTSNKTNWFYYSR